MPTVLIAPAKLTTSLRVVGTRPDGYHLIDAEMVTLDLADTLVLDELGPGAATEVEVAAGGQPAPLGPDNLVARALAACGRSARVVLDKRIPPGAGLGGGSADAAAVLRWAGVTDLALAATIGADVPFCLVGGRARVTGIGEEVAPLPHRDQVFTLLTPAFGCSTVAVYRAWDDLAARGAAAGGRPGGGGNDLEAAALAVEPRLARARDELAERTGQRPRLAGSGSTWFVEGAHPGDGLVVARTTPAG